MLRGSPLRARLRHLRERVVERMAQPVAVARFDAPPHARLVDLDREAHAARHRDRERLGASHPAEAGGQHQPTREAAAEVTLRRRGEGLERALHDALRADVDPRARGHLPVHHQSLGLELAEVLPGRPARNQQRVRDQHARRPRVRAEDADRLAGLHQQRLVGLERTQRVDDRVERLPRSRGAARAAVDHQIVGPLRDLGIEVVHEHAECRLLRPAAARALGAARGAHSTGRGDGAHASSISCARCSAAGDSTQRDSASHGPPIGRSPSGAGATRRTAP